MIFKEIHNFTVPGNPIALKRHRHFTTKKGFIKTYDPNSEDKNTFLWKAISENKPKKPINKAISLDLFFMVQRPKSHYRTGKYSHLLKEKVPIYCDKNFDLDNLVKFFCDALNGVFWKDDILITHLYTSKIYSETPCTKVIIKEIIENEEGL